MRAAFKEREESTEGNLLEGSGLGEVTQESVGHHQEPSALNGAQKRAVCIKQCLAAAVCTVHCSCMYNVQSAVALYSVQCLGVLECRVGHAEN